MRALAAGLLLSSTLALADSNDLVGRGVVLDRGELDGQLTLAINARAGREYEPTSISPDLWFGATSELTVGITHSARSLSEIDPDRPFCVNGCSADHSVALDARYRVHPLVAPRVRLLLRDTDPFKPAATFGGLVRWSHGRVGLASDPYLRLGLANREEGNRATLMLPVQLAVQPTCKWVVGLGLAYTTPLAVIRDGWRLQASATAGVRPIGPLEIHLELAYRSVLGPLHEYRERVVTINVGWRQHVR